MPPYNMIPRFAPPSATDPFSPIPEPFQSLFRNYYEERKIPYPSGLPDKAGLYYAWIYRAKLLEDSGFAFAASLFYKEAERVRRNYYQLPDLTAAY